MAVKIMIKRRVAMDKEADLVPLIKQLRTLATAQPGYISGETLRNMNSPEEYLVIGTWQSVDEWKAWESSAQRSEIQDKINSLLEEKTECEIYHYSEKSSISLREYRQWEGG